MNRKHLIIIKSRNNKVVDEKIVYVDSLDELRLKTFQLKHRLEDIYINEFPDGLIYEVVDVD